MRTPLDTRAASFKCLCILIGLYGKFQSDGARLVNVSAPIIGIKGPFHTCLYRTMMVVIQLENYNQVILLDVSNACTTTLQSLFPMEITTKEETSKSIKSNNRST